MQNKQFIFQNLLFKHRHFVHHFCSQNIINSSTTKCDGQENSSAPSCSSSSAALVHVQNRGQWPAEVLAKFLADCSVLGDFVSEEEETQLLDEVWPHMKRMRWEDEHWDGQIQRYREREQMLENWRPENQALIRRIWHTSFPAPFEPSPYVHILDLHQDGLISPHLDKSRYCGRVISGLSLLSASVMRMRHKSAELGQLCVADLLLSRRSLYRLRNRGWSLIGRVNCSTQTVPRERRIALICREVVVPTAKRLRIGILQNPAQDPVLRRALVRRACKMQHFDAIFQQQHHEVATCSTQKRQQQTIATTDG
ncbi:hypothetical protein niasHT_015008 [Heterodera trifolii]|uniref:Alpha-ketoglutarate-dependent dioxygenase AlkB-like domain-containing protein n=1 Tax=Heterodera trifolii TaxID=157864 RepID=A0ABD2L0T0_9BILA